MKRQRERNNSGERYFQGISELKDPKTTSNFTRDISQNPLKIASYRQTKVLYPNSRSDTSTLKTFQCLCRAKDTNSRVKPSINQVVSIRNNPELTAKYEVRPRQSVRTYIHVVLPGVAKQAGKVIAGSKSVVKKEKHGYNSCRCHFKHQSIKERAKLKCKLELPLVTFVPSIHSPGSSNNTKTQFQYGRLLQSKQMESTSLGNESSLFARSESLEKDSFNEAYGNRHSHKTALYDVMNWKFL